MRGIANDKTKPAKISCTQKPIKYYGWGEYRHPVGAIGRLEGDVPAKRGAVRDEAIRMKESA